MTVRSSRKLVGALADSQICLPICVNFSKPFCSALRINSFAAQYCQSSNTIVLISGILSLTNCITCKIVGTSSVLYILPESGRPPFGIRVYSFPFGKGNGLPITFIMYVLLESRFLIEALFPAPDGPTTNTPIALILLKFKWFVRTGRLFLPLYYLLPSASL